MPKASETVQTIKRWNLRTSRSASPYEVQFKNIEDLYTAANVNFELYKKRCYSLENPFNSEGENNQNRQRIIDYIQSENKKN